MGELTALRVELAFAELPHVTAPNASLVMLLGIRVTVAASSAQLVDRYALRPLGAINSVLAATVMR